MALQCVALNYEPTAHRAVSMRLKLGGLRRSVSLEIAEELKPATDTPVVALKFAMLLLDAGLPPEAIQIVTGPRSEVGRQICSDRQDQLHRQPRRRRGHLRHGRTQCNSAATRLSSCCRMMI